MPILNGQRVSLDVWRAAQKAAAAPVVEKTVEGPETVIEQPRRRRPSRREQAVKAALGIVDESTSEPEEVTEPETPEATGEPEGEVEAATTEEETES